MNYECIIGGSIINVWGTCSYCTALLNYQLTEFTVTEHYKHWLSYYVVTNA